ncbi:Eco57I restriction-modification methylase domain-containing protein [Arcanobacterium hippocoleae]|uniref:Eco57I restriction-modification methylase domain-containing protein n=1 Tax=Arcanobacterium hippocoleae TaxID=149017 RepID=UPI00333E3EED
MVKLPYQIETGGAGRQASPIYPLFFEIARNLTASQITLITPSRWFTGGMGLMDFRKTMLQSHRISRIVDYINAKDCFSDLSISGRVFSLG